MQNYFELFDLPVQFTINRQALDKAYKEIQKLVHPDRFATATEAEKRTAMQWAAMANDAYQTLCNPVKRSAYLCALNGYDIKKETRTPLAPEFLMQQMEWRESLLEAGKSGNRQALEKLAIQHRHLYEQQMHTVQTFLDGNRFEEAASETRKMMFLEKSGEEIRRLFDELDSVN